MNNPAMSEVQYIRSLKGSNEVVSLRHQQAF